VIKKNTYLFGRDLGIPIGEWIEPTETQLLLPRHNIKRGVVYVWWEEYEGVYPHIRIDMGGVYPKNNPPTFGNSVSPRAIIRYMVIDPMDEDFEYSFMGTNPKRYAIDITRRSSTPEGCYRNAAPKAWRGESPGFMARIAPPTPGHGPAWHNLWGTEVK